MRKPLVAVLFAVALGFAALPLVSVLVLSMQDGGGSGGQVLVPVTNVAGPEAPGASRGAGEGGGSLLGFRMAEGSNGAGEVAASDEPMTAVPGVEGGRERYGFHTGGKREREGCERGGGVSSGT